MSMYDSSKIKATLIENKEYFLQPNVYIDIEKYIEEKHLFDKLDQAAINSFTRQSSCIKTPLIPEHIHILRNNLPKELCQSLIAEFDLDANGVKDPAVLAVLLPQIFNQHLDQQLISYFNSEYCILWWSIYKIGPTITEKDYSTHWHADAGPKKHLKVITYLNGKNEHGSDTCYLDKAASDKLKQVGYLLNDINHRVTDIKPLCQHFDIDYQAQYAQPQTGDSIIFNPYQLAHRACPTTNNQYRYVIDFCIVQSELSWREVIEKHYVAVFGGKPFEGMAKMLLKLNKSKTSQHALLEIPLNNELNSEKHLKFMLNNIFSNTEIALSLYQYIIKEDPKLLQCHSITKLIHHCKKTLQIQLNPDPTTVINTTIVQALMDLAHYQQVFKDSYQRYSPIGKPDATAIFWPNPAHAKHPSSKFEQLPFVKKHPIMNMTTPIGSAGSCFAFEIAKYFQQEGYNYVVTERNDDVNSGLIIDGYQPGDAIAKFCANYGILFNTPSFSQLAEKAFGLRNFEQILIESEQGLYLDPYRENVFFKSQQAYLDDYTKHLTAVKESFLNCKVFVVTLGLNECWQLHDGTVMSRNPRENMFQLVKHKTLTVEENVQHIQRFFDIIKQHNPDFTLIISVSPIPFLATGRADEHHIIAANCHSKAVLLVAAQQLVAQNQDMYYLPSYELVTECVENAWSEDTRHVKSEVVAKVVNMFEQIFVEEDTL